ncbi:hypothetical protein BN1088_1431042 [Sphingobacterium sp. PM2-P1-29]|nr:hypothetical protein BN1088_1431042 [Sphingobacterium sp. PM2-P1-29]
MYFNLFFVKDIMILSTTHIPSFWIPFGWYEEFLVENTVLLP